MLRAWGPVRQPAGGGVPTRCRWAASRATTRGVFLGRPKGAFGREYAWSGQRASPIPVRATQNDPSRGVPRLCRQTGGPDRLRPVLVKVVPAWPIKANRRMGTGGKSRNACSVRGGGDGKMLVARSVRSTCLW